MSDVFEVIIQESPLEVVFNDAPVEVHIVEDNFVVTVEEYPLDVLLVDENIEVLTIGEQGPPGVGLPGPAGEQGPAGRPAASFRLLIDRSSVDVNADLTPGYVRFNQSFIPYASSIKFPSLDADNNYIGNYITSLVTSMGFDDDNAIIVLSDLDGNIEMFSWFISDLNQVSDGIIAGSLYSLNISADPTWLNTSTDLFIGIEYGKKGEAGTGGGLPITIGNTPPSNPAIWDLWLDTN